MNKKTRLENFFKVFTSDARVLVVINADPDAIASSLAVKRLLWRKVSEVVITYFNTITRPDNLAMIRLLARELVPMAELDDRRFTRVVLVDSQPDHHECFGMFRCDAIIDHHPISCDPGSYVDIRPEYGSCSSIMTEYLKTAGVKPSQKLATALVLGIKTDTAGFLRQTSLEDVKAFQYLYRFANTHILKQIEQAELDEEDAEKLAQAILNRTVRKGMVFSHAGDVITPDQCVFMADFFMRISSIRWSVVSGIFEGKLIIILRNDGVSKSAGTLAKRAFGRIGSAGGHKSMARVEIGMEELSGIRSIRKWIVDRISKYVG